MWWSALISTFEHLLSTLPTDPPLPSSIWNLLRTSKSCRKRFLFFPDSMLPPQIRGLIGALPLSVPFGKCVNRLLIPFTGKLKMANVTADELNCNNQALLNHPNLSPLSLEYSKGLSLWKFTFLDPLRPLLHPLCRALACHVSFKEYISIIHTHLTLPEWWKWTCV